MLGKTPGKDREQGKATYPAAVGIAASRRIAQGLIAEAAPFADRTRAAELLRSLGALVLTRSA